MSGEVVCFTAGPEAQREFKSAADELLGALLSGRNRAANFYQANPTPENWRVWVRAQAAWQVAYLTELKA